MDILNEIWPFGKKQSDTPQPPAKKKPGEVWQTPAGRFGAINKSHPNYPRYFDTEEKARRYATARIKKSAPKPDQQITPTNPDSLAQKALSAEKARRKATFDRFKTPPDAPKNDDEETLRILQRQDNEPEKDKDSKFGGGGGFSGGGGGSSF